MIENQEDLDRFLGGLSPMLELLELVEKMGSHSLPIPTKDLRVLLDTLRTVAEKQASSSAELDRLRRWKEEATEVLAGWDRVADRLGAEQLGVAKSVIVLERIEQLEDETDRLKSDMRAMKNLAPVDGTVAQMIDRALSGWTEPKSRMATMPATYALVAALRNWRRSSEVLDDSIDPKLARAIDSAYELGSDWEIARHDEILDSQFGAQMPGEPTRESAP